MRSFILEAPLLGGCLEARPAAYQVSRYSGNPQTSQSLKSSHHSVPVRQLKLHDSRRLGLCSAKALTPPLRYSMIQFEHIASFYTTNLNS